MSIRISSDEGVSQIEIARPEKKNALTTAMYATMADALELAAHDPLVRAVVISGQPGIFTAGNDLEDFLRDLSTAIPPALRFMRALIHCDKPVIAAVTGSAIGIGVTLLLHCDLVYVNETARLMMPFVSLGLVPEFGSSLLLPQRVGAARAAEMLLLGEALSAQQAVSWGLANAALPAEAVLTQAQVAASRFRGLAPEAVRDSKRLLRAASRAEIEACLEREMAIFRTRLQSAESQEAIRAFLEKRPPDFSHR